MIFNTGYYHPMDRNYEDIGLTPKNIGIATHPAKDQLEELKGRIFQGASTVELGFFGQGKGSRGQGQATPESYGADERQAMKELARINEVKLSTHAAPGVTGFAGFTREYNFDDAARQRNINEVKKAIEFAADVTEGGPVVLHTGEFPRSVFGEYEEEKFKAYEEEHEKRVHYLVDKKTGRLIQGVRENEEVWLPVPEVKDGKEQFVLDSEGRQILDRWGKPIRVWKYDEKGIKMEPTTYHNFAKKLRAQGVEEGEISKKFFRMQQEMRKEHALGQSREYEGTYIDASKEREKLIERLRFFERMKATLSPKDYEQFKEKIRGSRMYEFIPPETVDPIDYLKQALEDNERRIGYGREIALSGLKEAYQIEEAIKNAKTLKEYGLDRTAASLADLAKFAIDKEKAKKLKEPLYVSPEAYDPEMYGGHPDEMREIVQAARKKFVERHKGEYGEKKAKELAESHIKATFDIGHAYTWKKYFQGSEKDFHKWIDKKVTGLLKDGIIGHVHVSDNFGYDDEHLTPGEGIIGKERLRSFVEKLKKYGIKDLIVEAGGQPGGEGWRAMLGGWDVFGSPIYGAERASWSDVHHSYFGRANAPMYVFGEYAPSNEFRGAPFWSGLGLE